MIPPDFELASYDYTLPADRIAQFPPAKRGESRLLALSRALPAYFHDTFFNKLDEVLPPNALLVANNSRVVPGRLPCLRENGGRAEFLLLTPLPLLAADSGHALVEGLIRPAAKIRPGSLLRCGGIEIRIVAKGEFGHCRADLAWQGNLLAALADAGKIPLPPYIRRPPEDLDQSRYQTVYASQDGSIAAPTAGLHFTQAIRAALLAKGFGWAELSLHVGYGTFSPVRAADIRAHAMHAEFVEIGSEAAAMIRKARHDRRPIIAVGTTTVRSLEGVFALCGEIAPFRGMLDPFIFPGHEFKVIDGLVTNFHLPKSTLLMLVAAFIGRERVLSAYARALDLGYRFFSYGDAMLILP